MHNADAFFVFAFLQSAQPRARSEDSVGDRSDAIRGDGPEKAFGHALFVRSLAY